VVANCGRAVIDRVRVDEANRLRADKPARRVVQRSAYGFRDDADFFLKNRAAFPGQP
jgi:hypothetical protein